MTKLRVHEIGIGASAPSRMRTTPDGSSADCPAEPEPRHRDTLLGLRSRIREWLRETGDIPLSRLAAILPNARAE